MQGEISLWFAPPAVPGRGVEVSGAANDRAHMF